MTQSRIPGFYKLPLAERQIALSARLGLDPEAFRALAANGGLTMELADHMIENVVSAFGLPMGVAMNFKINGADFFVPMVIEEPSVVAAASNAARILRAGGGFVADSDPARMIAQVQLLGVPDAARAMRALAAHRDEIMRRCDALQPGMVKRGGGTCDVENRLLDDGTVVVHLVVDCRDAMGANAVNTLAERMAPYLSELTGGRVGLRILSNLADRRCVRVRARVPAAALAIDTPEVKASGEEVRDRIVEASRFAELDPYRAATHNKGIMNGLDAVALATGQDWRGLEAGAHAFAARRGRYAPLSVWSTGADGALEGALELPMAVGTVGGAVSFHPAAKLAMQMLGNPNASTLGQVLAAAGMATNFASIRALATEGIQRGHMSLHHRRISFQQSPEDHKEPSHG